MWIVHDSLGDNIDDDMERVTKVLIGDSRRQRCRELSR